MSDEPHPAVIQWRRQIEMLEMWDRLGVLTAKGQDVLAYLRREVQDAVHNQAEDR